MNRISVYARLALLLTCSAPAFAAGLGMEPYENGGAVPQYASTEVAKGQDYFSTWMQGGPTPVYASNQAAKGQDYFTTWIQGGPAPVYQNNQVPPPPAK